MSETTNPDARICAWTNKPFEGKGYVLKTTEHPEEIISADALHGAGDSPKVDDLTRQVKALARRVSELEAARDVPAAPAAKKTAGGRPSAQGK